MSTTVSSTQHPSLESLLGGQRKITIESAFSTARLRRKVTKGPGSRAAGLTIAFKLIEAADDRWRDVNGADLVALVQAGATFRQGVLVQSELKEVEVARDQRVGPIHNS